MYEGWTDAGEPLIVNSRRAFWRRWPWALHRGSRRQKRRPCGAIAAGIPFRSAYDNGKAEACDMDIGLPYLSLFDNAERPWPMWPRRFSVMSPARLCIHNAFLFGGHFLRKL